MKLKYITISGANEYTDCVELANLLQQFPMVEVGIQVSGEKCGYGSARLSWIMALYQHLLKSKIKANVALHLNKDWVESYCDNSLPQELEELLSYKGYNGDPFIKRVQLNFKIGREKTPDMKSLCEAMIFYSDQRVIFSYNDSNAELIQKIYKSGFIFDNLFDSSFGRGIEPESREKPVFNNVLQGYAGGLGPENVAKVLQSLKHIDANIYIDAQRKLEDDNEHLDLQKAKQFIVNALKATRR